MIGAGRRFLASLQHENVTGTKAGDHTISLFGDRLRFFTHWMYADGYSHFREIGTHAFSSYQDYTLSILADEAVEKRTLSTIAAYLDIPRRLHLQSRLFQSIPDMIIPTDPLGGETGTSICKRLDLDDYGNVQPVPDQIARPAIQKAIEWVDCFSIDILNAIELRSFLFRRVASWNSNSYTTPINSGLTGFRFNIGGRDAEWRPPLVASLPVRIDTERGQQTVQLSPLQQLSDLTEDLVGACGITIHGLTGFRSSEGASLKALPLSATGLPACIEIRPSQIGLNEVFYIKGKLTKGRQEPVECEWVAGMRPRGTDYIPPPVRAAIVLTKIFSFWRDLSGAEDLWVSVKRGSGFARHKRNVTRVLTSSLLNYENNFIRRHVSIPNKFRGWRVNRAQWRKKFSHDIIKSDPDAIPEVRLHYQHLSDHIVESAYFGTDAKLLQLIEDEAMNQAAQDIARMIYGEQPYQSRVIDQLAAALKRLSVETKEPEDIAVTIRRELAHEGIRVWTGMHGDCFYRWENALCHIRSKGNVSLTDDRPLFEDRSNNTCGSCSNYIVYGRHRPYSLSTFKKRRKEWKDMLAAGELLLAEALHQKMTVARNYCSALRIPEDELS
ncbi:hypothetical protein [Rhizobium leguminosarum]|uniref:hypothetical protein n=1 Tax=Rhizobium leguminosarum TaxID=384 RepID=UPI001AEA1E81|nr:hypothetical protein [Rhizobium leguminosarum]MBP2446473.1 hypothetical protein [Rhizobium leguminosarum]